MVKLLMSTGIVLVILGSIVEVAIDIGDRNAPEFLPAPLSGLPSSDLATGLAGAGILAFLVGFALEVSSNPLPGGRILIGIVAAIAFLFAGGYVVGDNETEG